MTDLDPTPVPPRFPLAQLAFCAACVGMAAWLWGTYVWCVRVTPADLRAPDAWKRLEGRYVEVTGQPVYFRNGNGGIFVIGILDPNVFLDPDCQGADGLSQAAWVVPRSVSPSAVGRCSVAPTGSIKLILPSTSDMTETYRGRVVQMEHTIRISMRHPLGVDERMWQFGGEFFAGAAVAAMGALVLTLYLRRWVIERREARCGVRAHGPRPRHP